MWVLLALTSSCLTLFILHIKTENKSLHQELDLSQQLCHWDMRLPYILNYRLLMAQKQLNMVGKVMDPNLINYNIINCAIPSKITIEYRYQNEFGNSGCAVNVYCKESTCNSIKSSIHLRCNSAHEFMYYSKRYIYNFSASDAFIAITEPTR